MKPFSHGFFRFDTRRHGGFIRFYLCGHGAANMCLPEEGCELWQVMSFYGVLIINM